MENTVEVGHHEHGGENDQKVEGKASVANWKFRKPISPDEKDLRIDTEEDELESTRAKIGEVREENERLKTVLSQIVKDYKSLQMHFFDIVQQEQPKKPVENSPKLPIDDHHAEDKPHELVLLSLGTSSTEIIKREENGSKLEVDDGLLRSDGLTLGLECKNMESSNLIPGTSSFEEAKEEDHEAAGEAWPPSKMTRNMRGEDDDVELQSNIAKRARVSVRARCDGPTMNDGCQWRKYGQKVSKGNPCPRAYYRCTVAPGCPVRKQVQRCIDDTSILITTYEGTHNHPLPVSATAMASTTSAAAHMLTSGPTAPRPATGSTSLASTLGPNGSFYISNPYPSPSTSHPTITIDLTSNSNSSSTSTTSHYLYPAGSSQQNYWQRAASSGHSYNYPPPQQRSSLSTDMIARAITSDPSFQSALVAAITSYVGARGAAHEGSAFGSMRTEGSGGSPVMFGTVAGLSATNSASASGSPVDERKQND